VTVQTALDRAARKVDERFRDNPRVEAAIRSTIGITYGELGQFHTAIPHLERALELQLKEHQETNPETWRTMDMLGGCYSHLGEPAAAFHGREQANRG
jgi:hypothetical protein